MNTITSKNIAKALNNKLPETEKFWLVRGRVLNVEETTRPNADPEKINPNVRDLVVQISDVDNPADGYDIQIEGIMHEIEQNDLVLLLGHEPRDAERVSHPRVIVNNSTGYFTRAYPLAKTLPHGVLPMVERKYWLSAKRPATPKDKLINFAILLGAVLLPYFVIGIVASGNPILGPFLGVFCLLLILLVLLPWSVFIFLMLRYITWIEEPKPFSDTEETPRLFIQNYRLFMNYKRHDLTAFYEEMARHLCAQMLRNPDEKFAPVKRGLNTVGLFAPQPKTKKQDEAPAKNPETKTAATLPAPAPSQAPRLAEIPKPVLRTPPTAAPAARPEITPPKQPYTLNLSTQKPPATDAEK